VDVPLPEGGIFEKLGQRLKERSDKVQRVNTCFLTLCPRGCRIQPDVEC
jgi:hypothetical protein